MRLASVMSGETWIGPETASRSLKMGTNAWRPRTLSTSSSTPRRKTRLNSCAVLFGPGRPNL